MIIDLYPVLRNGQEVFEDIKTIIKTNKKKKRRQQALARLYTIPLRKARHINQKRIKTLNELLDIPLWPADTLKSHLDF